MARVTGGRNSRRFTANARRAQARAVKQMYVGFFDTAQYPDGTPVTNVAAQNEFGFGVPERPFFRQALAGADRGISAIVRRQIDGRTMAVPAQVADQVGAWLTGEIQASITTLRQPPNAPSTIRAKGSSNPLIDTSFMRQSVTWELDR